MIAKGPPNTRRAVARVGTATGIGILTWQQFPRAVPEGPVRNVDAILAARAMP